MQCDLTKIVFFKHIVSAKFENLIFKIVFSNKGYLTPLYIFYFLLIFQNLTHPISGQWLAHPPRLIRFIVMFAGLISKN